MIHNTALTRRFMISTALAFGLSGCGVIKPNPAVTLKAEEAYVLLVSAQDERLFGLFPAAMQDAKLVQVIREMRAAIPPGPTSAPVLSGWEQTKSTDGGAAKVTFVYSYPSIPAFVTTETEFTGSDKAGWTLSSMYVTGKRGTYVEAVNLGHGVITPPPVMSSTEPEGS